MRGSPSSAVPVGPAAAGAPSQAGGGAMAETVAGAMACWSGAAAGKVGRGVDAGEPPPRQQQLCEGPSAAWQQAIERWAAPAWQGPATPHTPTTVRATTATAARLLITSSITESIRRLCPDAARLHRPQAVTVRHLARAHRDHRRVTRHAQAGCLVGTALAKVEDGGAYASPRGCAGFDSRPGRGGRSGGRPEPPWPPWPSRVGGPALGLQPVLELWLGLGSGVVLPTVSPWGNAVR